MNKQIKTKAEAFKRYEELRQEYQKQHGAKHTKKTFDAWFLLICTFLDK